MADSRTRTRSSRANTDGIVLNHLQPQALELEEAVIGALMIEQDAFPKVSDIVKKESFYDHRHQVIYEAVANLSLNQRPIDILTVTEQLKSNGTLEEAGGALYVTQLAGKVTSSAHIEYHARIIAQKAMARELITFTSEIQTEAFDDTTDISELLGEAENKLFQIAHRNVKKDFASIDVVLQESVDRIRTAASRAEGMSGLASGFRDLDNITSGWQKSDLIILAARPAMGKTAFALSMAKNIAVNNQKPVALFSLPVLQELKKEIKAYLDYAEPQLKKGTPENQLLLFSTTNLHIFQTYYGGLRQNTAKDEWIYGDYELVKQFIEEGELLKPWLMSMGVGFSDSQSTLVGALWYRGSTMNGCTTDADGDGTPERYQGNWGSYVMAPLAVVNNADKHNRVMRETSANELIFENGRVTGVKAKMADGTQVTAHAKKGV